MTKRLKKRKQKTSIKKSAPVRPPSVSRAQYITQLHDFDSTLCEAIAISQAQAGRYTDPNVGYGSRVFAKICSHGTAMIRAAPLSRWVKSESENWDFNCVAGHARAILEGCLLFNNLTKKTDSEDERTTRINILHLNDCTRRIELMRDIEGNNEITGLEAQQRELQTRLQQNIYFRTLPPSTKTRCLNGKNLTIETRDEGLEELGFSKGQFDAIFDLLSQHTHILPLSFYRMEPNGRGTGIENDTDRSYIAFTLGICSGVLKLASDKVVSHFPDIADARQGLASKFSPGPASNRPAPIPPNISRHRNDKAFIRRTNRIGEALANAWPQSPAIVNDDSKPARSLKS